MKKLFYKTVILGLFVVASSCVDRFLDIESKNLQTENSAFRTYENFLTYSWGLYSVFPSAATFGFGDDKSPWMSDNTSTNRNIWAYQKVTEASLNAEWSFSYIRQVNVLLDNIDKSLMTSPEKEHWRSVGLFFRSFKYFEMLSLYGDVPWLEHVVTEADGDVIYGKRTPRDEVASNILRDLLFAEEHINPNGDGPNTINVHVVRALISRFGLFEGTWRRYHGLGDAEPYLNACITASENLAESFSELHDNYDELFNTQDLTGMKGVILFSEYVENIRSFSLSRTVRASGSTRELTKEMVEKYLCTDGKPISTSPLYDGDRTPFDEFRNRDHRLLFTVLPPSRVFKPGSATSIEWRFLTSQDVVKIGATPERPVTKEDSVTYREYIDLLAEISSPSQKALPVTAWNNTLATNYTPRFRNFPEGISPFSGQHGYWFYKYYDTNPPLQSTNHQDIPLFRIGEILLNYAEAKHELGQFDQAVADATINRLRGRVGVASMNVSEINGAFDLNRDPSVSPILWEIRRERHVELIGEDFIFDDIRRWKKGEYYNTQQKGAWVKNAEYNNTLKIEGFPSVTASKDQEGYVVFLDPPLGWQEHYYFLPIPMKDLVLNPELEQNPGYAKP